jgi:pyruvate/2-oxoglutarate dehydrogenase complex dihydrolipoamide dehydrogenase (E3) component
MTHTYGSIEPDDALNRTLLDNVHPSDWENPVAGDERYNLVVIGGGTAGLISAIGTAGLGGRVALIERHLLGGDCLNVGCVPSKALIAAAHVAQSARDAAAFGVSVSDVSVDFGAVMERMRRIRAGIAPHDSAQRFKDQGVDVFIGEGRFTGKNTVEVGGQTLKFARAVIATGASAFVPPIEGIDQVDVLTNDSLFELTELPPRLAVIGGGPIGSEMAQSFRRFGSEVTLIDMGSQLLGKDDPDAAEIVRKQLVEEGIKVVLNARVNSLGTSDTGKVVTFEVDGASQHVEVDQILVSAGRKPNTGGLGLDAAGVDFGRRGVTVTDTLKTTNSDIYACGDVASKYQFTHTADANARIVIQNALFFGRKKSSKLVVPWVTYTDPEVAHVGPIVSELNARDDLQVFTAQLADNDRAKCDGKTAGFARVYLDKKGRIEAATVVASNAGDIIAEAVLAKTQGLKIGAIHDTIHSYPTQVEILRQVAAQYNRTRLTPFAAKFLKAILKWRR